jgi:hypothetical protein
MVGAEPFSCALTLADSPARCAGSRGDTYATGACVRASQGDPENKNLALYFDTVLKPDGNRRITGSPRDTPQSENLAHKIPE